MPNDLHSNFLMAVDQLGLKFPGANISKSTGYGSSIVSEYLKGKKELSENFLRKFCEKYNFDYDALVKGEIIRRLSPSATTNEEIVQAATVKMLFNEIALIKAKLFENDDMTKAITKMKDSTSSIIIDMLTSKQRET